MTWCTTRDEFTHSIKRANDFERRKIENAILIDTIFQVDVHLALLIDSANISTLEKQIVTLKKEARNVRKTYTPEKIKIFFKRMENVEKHLEISKDRFEHFEKLNTGTKDGDVCGYIIMLKLAKRSNEYVIDKNYKLLGPSFLYEFDQINY